MIGELFEDDEPSKPRPHVERSAKWKAAEESFDAAATAWKRVLAKKVGKATRARALAEFEEALARVTTAREEEDARVYAAQEEILRAEAEARKKREDERQGRLF